MNPSIKAILILMSLLTLNACGELQQDATTANGFGKSNTSENRDVMCAMIMVPMFNPSTTVCVEAINACEALDLRNQGFVDLSIKDYCDMGCSSQSCESIN